MKNTNQDVGQKLYTAEQSDGSCLDTRCMRARLRRDHQRRTYAQHRNNADVLDIDRRILQGNHLQSRSELGRALSR